jgi:disulfide oxidoreductase YuzD
MHEIEWFNDSEQHNYPAALSYLSLLFKRKTCSHLVKKLHKKKTVSEFQAKDIFRASGLSLLGISNKHIERDKQKIRAGEKLSPLLLVRDPVHGKVIIADGYHRLCAVYSYDEDAMIPCKIVSLPGVK